MKNTSNNEQRGQDFAAALEAINNNNSMTTAEKVARVHDVVAQLIRHIEAMPTRSAWNSGVSYYAGYLLDNFAEYAEYEIKAGRRIPCLSETVLLNGAADWTAYSYGGCALIYDTDIARAVCAPCALRRTRDGERQPNGRETWLDVQARALSQAWRRIRRGAKFVEIQ